MPLDWLRRAWALFVVSCSLLGAGPALAGEIASAPPARQSLDDAWWTGPLLASGASTLPRGHALIEPYFYDFRTVGRFDRAGDLKHAPNDDSFGSQSYWLYGFTDTFTAGFIPRFGYRSLRNGAGSSSGLQLGDVTVQGQYRLTQWKDGGFPLTTSLVFGETLPTGHYQRLERRPNDGFGVGAWSTSLGLYSQTYFWTPNGRILRARLDLSYAWSGRADLHDRSVYGTPTGFSGNASPGDVFTADLAFEYSATRNWVLALDLGYEHDNDTGVFGRVTPPAGGAPSGYQASFGSSEALIVAPAVEYNFSPAVGVIVGARIVAAGRNTTSTVTPAVAINYVL